MTRFLAASVTFALCLAPAAVSLRAQSPAKLPDAVYFPSATTQQTETDEYTRYELLDPSTASFKIYYEVTATTAGAKFFYNPIRKGSVASDESVLDPVTGKPLAFSVVSGEDARKDPLMARAEADTDYIRVELARPVPTNGQGRVVIIKTYKDPKSYFTDAHGIVFNRPLGIKRNKVVLPPGYELTACTVPSQILTEKDGRLAIAFMHAGTGEAPPRCRIPPPPRTPGKRPSPASPSVPASPSAPTPTATSPTSSNSPKPTPSGSTTTTPRPAPAPATTSTSSAPAPPPPTPPPTRSIPAKPSPRKS